MANVHEQLEHRISHSGSRQVPKSITPTHAGTGVNDHQAVAMAAWGCPIPIADVHAQCVAWFGDLGTLASSATFQVDKVTD